MNFRAYDTAAQLFIVHYSFFVKLGCCGLEDFARCADCAVALLKFVHTARRVDEFLFAGEERVACGANADFNVFASRASAIRRATCAGDDCFCIIRMYVCLHFSRTG